MLLHPHCGQNTVLNCTLEALTKPRRAVHGFYRRENLGLTTACSSVHWCRSAERSVFLPCVRLNRPWFRRPIRLNFLLSRFVRERTSGLLFRLPVGGRKLDTNVKLLLIAGIVGLVIGVGLTIFYFSLAHFFAVNARAVDTFAKNQRVAENGSENAEVAAVTNKKRGAGA